VKMVKRYLIFLVWLFLFLPIPATADYLVGGATNYLLSTDPALGSSDTTVSTQNAVYTYMNNNFCPVNGYLITTQNVPSLTNGTNLGSLSSGLLKMSVSGGVAVLSTAIEGTDYVTSCPSGSFASLSSHYLMLQNDATLPNSFNLGSLSTGLLKVTVSGGVAVPTIAVDGVDYLTIGSLTNYNNNLIYWAGFMPSNDVKTLVNEANIAAIKTFLGYYTSGDTISGTFSGNLTGNVSGNVTGNLTGNITGNVSGNLTGNVTGNLTGNASTAAALAANPTTCAAGYAALGIDAFGNAQGCWQPIASNANLLSLSGLSYGSPSFVKMTGANTFVLDTTLYQPLYPFTITGTSGYTYNLDNLSSGGSSFNPATPGPIGGTTPAAITGTTITGSSFISSLGNGYHYGDFSNTTSCPTLTGVTTNPLCVNNNSGNPKIQIWNGSNAWVDYPNGTGTGNGTIGGTISASSNYITTSEGTANTVQSSNCTIASDGTMYCPGHPWINFATAASAPASSWWMGEDDTTGYFWFGTGNTYLTGGLVSIDTSGNVNIPTGAKYKINGTALAASDVGAAPAAGSTNITTIGAVNATSLAATGVVDGLVNIVLSSATSATTISSATYKTAYYFNQGNSAANSIYTLPTAAAGLQYCVKNYTGITQPLKFQTSASGQYIDLNGTLSNTGGDIKTGGAAGDGMCVIGVDAAHWVAYCSSGTCSLN
jgi:hypothetical protein